jgi:beta-N-acetylhexosaminidase
MELWQRTMADLRSRAGKMVIACDGDMSAVDRLHAVIPGLPTLVEAEGMSSEQVEASIAVYAQRVASLGVTMLLSPTADLIGGTNEWLRGRTLGDRASAVDRLVAAYVRGANRGGIHSALKHFPGHHSLRGNPATDVATVPGDLQTVLMHAGGFRAGIAAGARAVLMGSAIFEAVAPPASASLSRELIALLRQEFGFTGLVITLDLDHRSAQGNASIEHTCVAALMAGADLLLLSPGSVPSIPAITRAIAKAVDTGQLSLGRLESAFASVSAATV